jgi:large subunit ribosomal protein L10
MPRPEKVATVEEIREKLEGSRAAVLTEYRGLKVSELAALRASLRSADAEYKVYKNTLARRAAEEAGLSDLVSMLQGPTAITFVKGDAVTVAKALRDYSKGNANLVVKGGILGTRVIQPDDIIALADIQPREVLLARIAGGFQAPLVKAAGLFQAFTRNMAYGLKALIDQRVAGGEALPADEPEPPAAEAEAPPAAEAEAPPAAEAEAPPAAVAEAPAAEAPIAEAEAPLAAAAEAEAPLPAAAEAVAPAEEMTEAAPPAEAAAPEEPAAEAAEAETETSEGELPTE